MPAKKIFKPNDADKVIFKPTQALCPRCQKMKSVVAHGSETAPILRLAEHEHVIFIETIVGNVACIENGRCKGSGVLVVHLMAAEVMNVAGRRRAA